MHTKEDEDERRARFEARFEDRIWLRWRANEQVGGYDGRRGHFVVGVTPDGDPGAEGEGKEKGLCNPKPRGTRPGVLA